MSPRSALEFLVVRLLSPHVSLDHQISALCIVSILAPDVELHSFNSKIECSLKAQGGFRHPLELQHIQREYVRPCASPGDRSMSARWYSSEPHRLARPRVAAGIAWVSDLGCII